MKAHPTIPDALISDDETFVLRKEHFTQAMQDLSAIFEDDFRAADLDRRRGIAGACLTFAMNMPEEGARELFENSDELHRTIDTLVAGFEVILAIKDIHRR